MTSPIPISTTQTLAELVTADEGMARVLEQFGLDYCCGGQQSLAEAAAEQGVDPDAVISAARALHARPEPAWAAMGPGDLVDHLEATHHAYLHTELPRLGALMAKVAEVHGSRHGELAAVQASYEALRADLEPHLVKEERVLFPMIRELCSATTLPQFHCGSLRNPISMMLIEHDQAGALLRELREQTAAYAVPADGCASYQALYAGLADLEADTHLHIHKENNLLFPAVVRLEERLAGS